LALLSDNSDLSPVNVSSLAKISTTFLDKFAICDNNNDSVVSITGMIFAQPLVIALKRKLCFSSGPTAEMRILYCYNYVASHEFATNLAFFAATGLRIFQFLAVKNLRP